MRRHWAQIPRPRSGSTRSPLAADHWRNGYKRFRPQATRDEQIQVAYVAAGRPIADRATGRSSGLAIWLRETTPQTALVHFQQDAAPCPLHGHSIDEAPLG